MLLPNALAAKFNHLRRIRLRIKLNAYPRALPGENVVVEQIMCLRVLRKPQLLERQFEPTGACAGGIKINYGQQHIRAISAAFGIRQKLIVLDVVKRHIAIALQGGMSRGEFGSISSKGVAGSRADLDPIA